MPQHIANRWRQINTDPSAHTAAKPSGRQRSTVPGSAASDLH